MPRLQEHLKSSDLRIIYNAAGRIIDIVDESGVSMGTLVTKMATASRPAYAAVPKGYMYFDTTTNKLVFAGATAYETVTSV